MSASAAAPQGESQGILVVDASSMSRNALTKLLAKHNTVFAADSTETAWALLEEHSPSCTVVDVEHDPDGAFALVELMRNATNPWLRNLPVLVLGTADEQSEARALEIGASAYLGKPFDSNALLKLVSSPPRSRGEGSNSIAAPDSVDPLTGVPQADYFDYRGEKELAFARRYNKDLSVILFQVDDLESLVANHGAPLAKQVIRKLSKYLIEAIRGEDTLARLGGRRFGVIAPTCNEFGAKSIADRVLERVRQRVFQYGQQRLSFTVSAGLASPRISQSRDFAEIVGTARKRLKSAVAAGGDQAVFDGRSLEHALTHTQQHRAVDDAVSAAPDVGLETAVHPAVGTPGQVEDMLEDTPSLDVVMWLLENGLEHELEPHYGKLLEQLMPLLERAGAAMGPEMQALIEKMQASKR